MTYTNFDTSLLTPHDTVKLPPLEILTSEEQDKYDQVEAHFSKTDFGLPVKDGDSEKTGLSERELMFLSRNTFIRFLKATKYDVAVCITRIENALMWRRTERVDDLDHMSKVCSEESSTGKNIVQGFTPNGQPVLYFYPARNMTPPESRKAVHAIYMVERAIDLMGDGVTSLYVVFNMAGKRQGPPTSVSVARECLHILGNHYPETLGMSVFLNMPFVVKMFVNLMWPFVDPATKLKVKFGTDIVADGDIEKKWLMSECGGDLDIIYDHDTYWPALAEKCRERREEDATRWRALGEPKVGREERLFKLYPKSVGSPTKTADSRAMLGSEEKTAPGADDRFAADQPQAVIAAA